MITKEQAEQIKEMALDMTFAMCRYHDIPANKMADKRKAWDDANNAEKALSNFVDNLVR